MDEATIESIGESEMLAVVNNKLGGWPILTPNAPLPTESAFDRLLRFQTIGLKPFFDVYISANPKDSEAYSLRVC
jgi:hypothetical protein